MSGANRSKIERRKAETTGEFKLGLPLMPQSRERNWRRTWAVESKKLLDARKLALSDGSLLASLCDALRGSRIGSPEERAASHAEVTRIRAIFDARAPFEESKPVAQVEIRAATCPPIAEFIEGVRRCRDSFESRIVPGQTITLDEGGKPYEFPEGDALTVAKQYAKDVVAGKIAMGKLWTCACQRFLDNITTGGSSRGFFFDPWEARIIVDWFRFYCTWPLQPWQVLIALDVFAFKKPSGVRLRSTLWLEIGRKNAKTWFCGGMVLFCIVADLEKRAEAYSYACMKEQARLSFRDATACVQDSPELSALVTVQKQALSVEDTGSFFKPISSDSSTADGLRVHVGFGDESHAWVGSGETLHAKITTGQLSRRQPLTLLATTAGEKIDEGFCYTQHEIYKRFLTGVVEDHFVWDSTACYIACLDDDDDMLVEANWLKSNPGLGVTVNIDKVREHARKLGHDNNAKFQFNQFVCCRWNTEAASGGSLPVDYVTACLGVEGMPLRTLRNAFLKEAEEKRKDPNFRMYGGADAGATSDFFSYTLFLPKYRFANPDGKFEDKMIAVNFFWIKEEDLKERGDNWNVPIRRWVDEGWVKLAGLKYVDKQIVHDDIVALHQRFNVVEIGWDEWNTKDMRDSLYTNYKIVNTIVKQVESQLTAPSNTLIAAILDKKILLTDPVTKWMLCNVDFTPAENKGVKPKKPKRYQTDTVDKHAKIDAVSSMCNAIHRWLNPDLERQKQLQIADKWSKAAADYAAGKPVWNHHHSYWSQNGVRLSEQWDDPRYYGK
jgi:phage terminase large subunit-like protein